MMNIAVIGCGSIGGVIAARLLNAGKHQIFIIDSSDSVWQFNVAFCLFSFLFFHVMRI